MPKWLATDGSTQNCMPHELEEFIKSVRFKTPTAVTLTMKKRAGGKSADPITASRNFQHFHNRLNHKLLGSRAKRYGARLRMVVILELSADHRLHFHCIIDRPCDCSFPDFAAIIRKQWWKTDFGYHQVDVQDQPNAGCTDYILKQRQKRSLLDSIDWANCQLIAD
jgi:hypothetical protein